MLYDLLQKVAEQVCGINERSYSVFCAASTADKKACYEEALSRAVAEIDAPLVKAQHAG